MMTQSHAPLSSVDLRSRMSSSPALVLLIIQNVVTALVHSRGIGMGLSLIAAFVVTVICSFVFFPRQLQALRQDSRWLTAPSIGFSLGVFGLGFLASRAMAMAYISFFPLGAKMAPPPLGSTGADFALLVLAAGLLIPFAEEVVFRGLMMRQQERKGLLLAAVASSIAFALAHGVPLSVVGILPLAYLIARAVQHSGSLWNGVLVHAFNNTLAVGLGHFANHLPKSVTADASTQLLQSETMRWGIGGGALLFGIAALVMGHFWLIPQVEPQPNEPQTEDMPNQRKRKNLTSWFSPAYITIVIFGIISLWLSIPANSVLLRSWLQGLHG